MVVGIKSVTERAYQQPRPIREEAVRFAEATVLNGLGPNHALDRKTLARLKAQLERDYLVARLAWTE